MYELYLYLSMWEIMQGNFYGQVQMLMNRTVLTLESRALNNYISVHLAQRLKGQQALVRFPRTLFYLFLTVSECVTL